VGFFFEARKKCGKRDKKKGFVGFAKEKWGVFFWKKSGQKHKLSGTI